MLEADAGPRPATAEQAADEAAVTSLLNRSAGLSRLGVQAVEGGPQEVVAPPDQELAGEVGPALPGDRPREPAHVRRGAEGGHHVPVGDLGGGPAGRLLPAGADVVGGLGAEADGGVAAQRAEVDPGRAGAGAVPVDQAGQGVPGPQGVALPQVAVHEDAGRR